MSWTQIMRGSKRKLIKICSGDRDKFIEELKAFVTNAYHTFNSYEIINHINSKLNENYKSYWIRGIMKRQLKLTTKNE